MANLLLKIRVFSFTIFLWTIYIFHLNYKFNWKNEEQTRIITYHKSNLSIFNLSKPLEPAQAYSSIQCRKSAFIYVSTTLCIYDTREDAFISNDIATKGAWEPGILSSFTTYLKSNPDWLVFDIGSNIGQYCLFAAKMDRDVICIEPFYDSIIRIHKAAKIEKLEDKITLIMNAVSNVPNELKLLETRNKNKGALSLVRFRNRKMSKQGKKYQNKYLVKTIVLDDLIDYLPKNRNNQIYKKAIMKIDIEGFEAYALQGAQKLFDFLDFQVIFMEWAWMSSMIDDDEAVVNMINFLLDKNFKPFDGQIELILNYWREWPLEIIWKKIY